jgi:hypothetical protein
MKIHKIQLLVISIFLLATSAFSENNKSGIKTTTGGAPFVQKVMGVGRVIDAIQTRDGNYISINAITGGSTFTVRKATDSGRRIWERSLSVPVLADFFDGYVSVTKIAETNDGFVLVGRGALMGYYSNTVGILIKLHRDGTLKWHRKFEIGGQLTFDSVESMPDGGFIVTGGLYPTTFHRIVARFTSHGNILWAKQFESLYPQFSSHSLSDNGVVLASEIYSEELQRRIGLTLVKIDSSGQIQWSKNLTLNDSVAWLGGTWSQGTLIAINPLNTRMLSLVRLDDAGKIEWKANYSLDVNAFSISNVFQTPDGGYTITGTTTENKGAVKEGFFIKINAQRDLLLQKIFGFKGVSDEAGPMLATQDGAYVLFGSTYGFRGRENDMLFLKLNAHGLVPGCNFVRHLNATKLQPLQISISNSTITSQPLSLPSPSTLEVHTIIPRNLISTACK